MQAPVPLRLAPKGIIKGPAGEVGAPKSIIKRMIGMKSLLEQKVAMDDDTE